MITISPGHWYKTNSGASDIINEVTEARRIVNKVVEILKSNGVTVHKVEDNSSSNQRQNLNYLVAQHNKTNRKLDVSVHFNSSGSRTPNELGTEVLYYSEKDLAVKLSNTISNVSGLKNRGAKQRRDLAFLLSTNKPAILIEVAFVNSIKDVELYRKHFDDICFAISQQLAAYIGKSIVIGEGDNKTKEDDEMFIKDASSSTLVNAYIKKLEQAVKQGKINDDKWVRKAKDGSLSVVDMILLDSYIQ